MWFAISQNLALAGRGSSRSNGAGKTTVVRILSTLPTAVRRIP